jgi:hypothetical protein
MRRASAIDVGALAMSRRLHKNKQRRCVRSELRREANGRYFWQTKRGSMPAALPTAQHRGLIVPQLSATIAAASLPKSVSAASTPAFVKCTPIDNKDNDADTRNNSWRMKAFCQCVRRFGKATHTSRGRRVATCVDAALIKYFTSLLLCTALILFTHHSLPFVFDDYEMFRSRIE